MGPRQRTHPGTGSGPLRFPGTFVLAFREAAVGAGWQVQRWYGPLAVCADGHGHARFLDAEALFERLRRVERTDWPGLLSVFFRTVLATEMFRPLSCDLGSAADRLEVRLGPLLPEPPEAAGRWQQALDQSGLCLFLVAEHSGRQHVVTNQLVDNSGHTGEYWLGRALTGAQAQTPTGWFHREHTLPGVRQGVGPAAPARALLLDQLLPEHRSFGSFVAVPSHEELLVLPVAMPALAVLPRLQALVTNRYRTAAAPVSDELFWVHDQVWRRFPVVVRSGGVSIQPPDEFVDIFHHLLPGEEHARERKLDEEEAED